MRTLVAYVPVLHDGYRRFFEQNDGPKELYIFGNDFIESDRELSRDIRQIDPVVMKKVIEALNIFQRVEILNAQNIGELNRSDADIVLPDEEISRALSQTYFSKAQVSFSQIFLRWDKHNATAELPVVSAEQIIRDEFHKRVLNAAEQDAQRSSDNWRHVGAAIVKEGEVVLVGHNAHVPTEQAPYVSGDPRNNFRRGVNIEISSAIHAEASLIAEAARRGIVLEGVDMYVTTFPCPPCAKLIAYSGIKNLYCGGGYGVLDGEDVLRAAEVKIFFVE